jgi:hypothetical protein
MMRKFALALSICLPAVVSAQDRGQVLADVTEEHILPRFSELSEATFVLSATAQADCTPESPELRAAYHAAFDKWISASHLRFGPSEVDDRAFALAFWPDTKGFTAKALSGLIASEDTAVETPGLFAETSIAGRGFFALEQMIFEPQFSDQGTEVYRCALIRAIATDINSNANAMSEDWKAYAPSLSQPGADGPYRSDDEALQELYKSLVTGLEFTAQTRLGRPMGTFDRPRPKRAEARRSGRSLRHVELSLIALKDLAKHLSANHPEISSDLNRAFEKAILRAQSLDDPTFGGVSTPQGRLRIEALQQSIEDARQIAATRLGPTLGISAGFNSLDGD